MSLDITDAINITEDTSVIKYKLMEFRGTLPGTLSNYTSAFFFSNQVDKNGTIRDGLNAGQLVFTYQSLTRIRTELQLHTTIPQEGDQLRYEPLPAESTALDVSQALAEQNLGYILLTGQPLTPHEKHYFTTSLTSLITKYKNDQDSDELKAAQAMLLMQAYIADTSYLNPTSNAQPQDNAYNRRYGDVDYTQPIESIDFSGHIENFIDPYIRLVDTDLKKLIEKYSAKKTAA